jgi:hypothetical protein
VLCFALALCMAACGEAGPHGSGTATLNWSAVTRRSDGSALTDLAGYKVYYGTSPGALNQVVVVADPRVTTYRVTHLAAGTWYFAVAAYTSSGAEGPRSGVGSKTIH